jgi:hypothetical protein
MYDYVNILKRKTSMGLDYKTKHYILCISIKVLQISHWEWDNQKIEYAWKLIKSI